MCLLTLCASSASCGDNVATKAGAKDFHLGWFRIATQSRRQRSSATSRFLLGDRFADAIGVRARLARRQVNSI